MAVRWYLMPIDTINSRRGPKYLKWRENPTGLDVPWAMMDYGLMPVAVLWANVTNSQHTGLTANSDVRHIVMHVNVDNTVGGSMTAIRNGLEGLQIPGTWVQSTDTWRAVLRGTMGMFQFAQRLHGGFGLRLVPEGLTLNSTWSDLSAEMQTALLSTARELGIDTSQATGAVTLRQIYRAFGNAWGEQPFYVGGVEV